MIMGTMKYKGYTGSVDYSEEDNCLYGEVLGKSKDFISYEGKDVDSLRKDFEETVKSARIMKFVFKAIKDIIR